MKMSILRFKNKTISLTTIF